MGGAGGVRRFKMNKQQKDFNLFDIVFAGIITTVGGNATETFQIRGVQSTDVVLATTNTPASAQYVIKGIAGKNLVTLTFSGDPSSTTKVNIVVIRERANKGVAKRKY